MPSCHFSFECRPKGISSSPKGSCHNMATSDRSSQGTAAVVPSGFARSTANAPSSGEKRDVGICPACPAPESKTSAGMIAKLTRRLQQKVADENCCYRGQEEDLPKTPRQEPTSSSRFCHCPLVAPDSIDLGKSDADFSSGRQVASRRRREVKRRVALVSDQEDSDGGSSSATDITETLTTSVRSLSQGSSTPSSSLKSCLVSSTDSCDRGKGKTTRHRHRHVQFDDIIIRRYQIVLGDNPEVSVGPPISLGWTLASRPIKVDVDAYESHRSVRRQGNELFLPAFMRRQMLLRNGLCTSAEIAERVKEVKTVQSQRDRTVKWLPFAKVEEGAQSAKRKAARAAARVLKRKSSRSDSNKNCICNPCNDSSDREKDNKNLQRSQSFSDFDRRRTLVRFHKQCRSSQF